MAKKRGKSSIKSSQKFPVVVSLGVLLVLILTVYFLISQNTDNRSQAKVGNGIGQGVREEVSPLVRITSPSVNQVVTNPVSITADAPTGLSVERAQFYIDSVEMPEIEIFDAPYEVSLNLMPGRHRVHVLMFDADGNVKRSQEISFSVQ